MEEYELVGGATMVHKNTTQYSRVVLYFTGKARDIFKNINITFSPITLKIGFPTLDCRVSYTVKSAQFNFSYNDTNKVSNEEYEGKYNLYKISEDEYQLEKIES